jgi:hypothetical protein
MRERAYRSAEALRHPKAGISASVVGMPCKADDGVQGKGILRLRMTSTSWASCFAQDDNFAEVVGVMLRSG